ncbi:NAD(P)H-dependent oxidoreductase subunit E [Klebsiella pneumoniae]|uniref:NAD(P)H-dependent oxidoreductase subunit E n=1 Tax=Klebsiella pneumoniae TaxID=573 RepID=UPI003A5C7D17
MPDGAIYAIADAGDPGQRRGRLATFYSQIFRQPVGRHVIRCDSVVCHHRLSGYSGRH